MLTDISFFSEILHIYVCVLICRESMDTVPWRSYKKAIPAEKHQSDDSSIEIPS